VPSLAIRKARHRRALISSRVVSPHGSLTAKVLTAKEHLTQFAAYGIYLMQSVRDPQKEGGCSMERREFDE
jgi:hypothetical protein